MKLRLEPSSWSSPLIHKDGIVPLARKFVRYGASPRGAQALILCAKVSAPCSMAVIHVAKDDIDAWALPALRHRLIINFEGEAEGVTRSVS